MRSRTITHALKELVDSGNFDEQATLSAPEFKTTDIYPLFKHCFNSAALKTLESKTFHQVHEYYVPTKTGGLLVLLGKLYVDGCELYRTAPTNRFLFERKFDLVRLVASRATKDKLHAAVDKVITTINHLANKGFTKASLAPLQVLELQQTDELEANFAVLSYVTLTDEGYKYVQDNMPNMLVSDDGDSKVHRFEDQ